MSFSSTIGVARDQAIDLENRIKFIILSGIFKTNKYVTKFIKLSLYI